MRARLCGLMVGSVLTWCSMLIAVPEWTALIYVQANNNLSPFALKNFNDMTAIGSNDAVTTLVQWYQPGQSGTWRYKVEKGKLALEECNPAPTTDGSSARDLVDAMRWATTKHPAQKYSLVLWDHGIGILDPSWGNHRPWGAKDFLDIDPDFVKNNPRIQISGLTIDDFEDATLTTTSELLDATTTETLQRGILFNEHSKTYMDNQNLAQALKDISTIVLKGKKIDILGMDACLMAMVEISYLAHKHASILVASQEVELANGWNYAAFIHLLSTKNSAPFLVAQGIVKSYEQYYKDRVQFYTQSAINLEHIGLIKNNIDAVIAGFRACNHLEKTDVAAMAKKARRSCLQLSSANYIDLYTFYADFHYQLTTGNPAFTRAKAVEELKNSLVQGMHLIEQSVIAKTAGKNMARAKGLSIYFPLRYVDRSYPKTDFAKDCQWYWFIKELCGG
ncbi:MAG: clostripain-related cysteine peptidase [Candidatus Babeliales bacterium]